MQIWVVTQYFKPENNPPANRMFALAQAWQALGQQVRVLTALPNHKKNEIYPEYKNKGRFFKEDMAGVPVWRHWLWVSANKSAIPRALTQLSFMFTVLFKNLRAAKEDRPDVIMVTSPEFFCVISAWVLAVRYRVPFVMEVRDLWPAIFKQMGVLKNSFILWILEKLELFMYKRAKAVVTVTKGYARNIAKRKIAAEKIYIIPNGVADAEMKTALEVHNNGAVQRLQAELHLNPLTKVVLYIGNHGKAQALGQVVDAARLLMNRSDVQFIIAGGGVDTERLEKLAQGIPNIHFLGNQPKEKVWAFYGVSTISLVCLKDIEAFNTTIPSKIFEIMTAKKPLIACVKGEAAEIITTSGAGVVVPPENPEALAKAVTSLIDEPARLASMGEKGRIFAENERRYSTLAGQYLGILQKIVADKKGKN